MDNYKVSIVVPVYNAERYLNECIQSLIGQTEADIEIILVNDGSTDGSLQVLRNYEKLDSRLHIIDMDNHGVSHARNKGIEAAKADWIMFVDADDRLPLDSIEHLYAYVTPETDIVCGAYREFTDDNDIEKYIESSDRIDLISDKELLSCCCIVNPHTHNNLYKQKGAVCPSLTFVWGKLYRKSTINKNDLHFDESLSRGEDQKFNFDFIDVCNKVSSVDSSIYYYRITQSSASRSWRNASSEYLQYSSIVGEMIDEKKYPTLSDFWNLKKFEIIMKMLALISKSDKNDRREKINELRGFIDDSQYYEAIHAQIGCLSRVQTIVQKLLRKNLLLTAVTLFRVRLMIKE